MVQLSSPDRHQLDKLAHLMRQVYLSKPNNAMPVVLSRAEVTGAFVFEKDSTLVSTSKLVDGAIMSFIVTETPDEIKAFLENGTPTPKIREEWRKNLSAIFGEDQVDEVLPVFQKTVGIFALMEATKEPTKLQRSPLAQSLHKASADHPTPHIESLPKFWQDILAYAQTQGTSSADTLYSFARGVHNLPGLDRDSVQ